MLNFEHSIPTRMLFGEGQIRHLNEVLAAYGDRVLLAYGGGSIKKTGLYDTVTGILKEGGFHVSEIGGIEPNPRIESVEKGVQICKKDGIQVVLAVGGGSTIDCAKAIAAGYYYEDGNLWDMVRNRHGILKALPLVDVLTLSATGSEFDPVGVITNWQTHEKLGSAFTYPAVSICDPTYTYSVPKLQTAAGSADIMSHIFEGYFSRTEDSDLSDGIAETILRSVIRNLPIALEEPDNYSARANLMVASSVACSGIPEYGKLKTGWPCHALEHELSAYYDVTHGVGLAILTPRWMRYILAKDGSAQGRFVRFARNVFGICEGTDAEIAEKGIERLESFFAESGLPMTLTELGIPEDHFEAMAVHANRQNRLEGGFVPLTTEDAVRILKACL